MDSRPWRREIHHNVSLSHHATLPPTNSPRIFNVACNGEVSAGVINGPQFNFVIVNNNVVVDNIPSGTVIRRDIEVPKGFLVLPKAATPVVSKLRCPNPGQFAVSKIPPVTPSSNGCGAASGASQYAPNFDFKPCCDGHDVCYGTFTPPHHQAPADHDKEHATNLSTVATPSS